MSLPNSMPIIRFEIEGMKHAILVAIERYAAQMDSDVKAAVDAFCSEDNLKLVISKHASDAINSTIKEEIDRFFRHGKGRSVIRDIVEKQLGGEEG